MMAPLRGVVGSPRRCDNCPAAVLYVSGEGLDTPTVEDMSGLSCPVRQPSRRASAPATGAMALVVAAALVGRYSDLGLTSRFVLEALAGCLHDVLAHRLSWLTT